MPQLVKAVVIWRIYLRGKEFRYKSQQAFMRRGMGWSAQGGMVMRTRAATHCAYLGAEVK